MASRRLIVVSNGVRGLKGDKGDKGDAGASGGGGALPSGGSIGQVVTNTGPGAGNWQDAPAGSGSGVPDGGTLGQVLKKTSNDDGAADWGNLTATDVGAVPTARTVNGKTLSTDIAVTNSDVKAPGFVREVSGDYPSRPAGTYPVFFSGPDLPDGDGTTGGGAGAVDGLDYWIQTDS